MNYLFLMQIDDMLRLKPERISIHAIVGQLILLQLVNWTASVMHITAEWEPGVLHFTQSLSITGHACSVL